MKRSFAKIVLIAAILVMVLGCASVFAAEESEKAEIAGGADGLKLNAGGIPAATLNYNTSKLGDYYTINTSGGDVFSIYPIEVKGTGKLYVNAEAASSNQYGCTIVVGSYDGTYINYTKYKDRYVSPGSSVNGIGYYDVKPGTYYVGIKSSAAATAYVTAYVVPYNTRSLKAGKIMIASGIKGSDDAFTSARFKIKATKTGYITVGIKEYGNETSTGYVTLLNSKKKTVSGKVYYSDSKDYPSAVVFGVKKGTTYYLKVENAQGSYDNLYMYGVKWKNYSATYKSNKSKKKALTLKRKAKAKKIARPATGKSMTQWYKIKVSRRTVKIVVNTAKMTADSPKGKTKVTVYRGKKRIGTTVSVYPNYKYTKTISYARKGTYYIKVTNTAKCNGMYTIRFKS